MSPAHILRLRRTDLADAHLLVRVDPTREGSLEGAELIGTEHEHVYHATLKESGIKALQASSFIGSLAEWKDVLRLALLHQSPESTDSAGTDGGVMEGLEVVAAIKNATLTITLRKNISNIAQRLGSIALKQDDSFEVSPFDWVDAAVATSDDLRGQLSGLQSSLAEQQKQVQDLNHQLDELVTAKREHEDALLKKFAALLNAKKLKVRDQLRLLNGAKIDADAAEAVGAARGGKARKAVPSRTGKRKQVADPEDEDDEMEVDEDGPHAEDDELRQETPPASDDDRGDATEDEDDDLGRSAPAPPPVRETESSTTTSNRTRGDEKRESTNDTNTLPPKRELPFANKKPEQPAKPSKPAAADDDDEDDETDDEL